MRSNLNIVKKISFVSIIIILVFLIYYFVRFKYSSNFDFVDNIAVYVNGEKTDSFPEKGSGFGFEKIECENGTVGTWDNNLWALNVDFSQADKCKVYFADYRPKIESVQLSNEGKVFIAGFENSRPIYAIAIENVAYTLKNENDQINELKFEQMDGTITTCNDKNGRCFIELNYYPDINLTVSIESEYYGSSEAYSIDLGSVPQFIIPDFNINFSSESGLYVERYDRETGSFMGEYLAYPGNIRANVNWSNQNIDYYNLGLEVKFDPRSSFGNSFKIASLNQGDINYSFGNNTEPIGYSLKPQI